jgi:hypothetical protein
MTIVMGLDQHRAQITAEWIDTETGEISRGRVAPPHRESVRRFLARFRGQHLEVALEATTGWRFVVEELRRVGAKVHLAEPGEPLIGEVGQRRSTPHPERITERGRGLARVAALKGTTPLGHQRLEAPGVDLGRLDLERIAAAPGQQHARSEDLTEV